MILDTGWLCCPVLEFGIYNSQNLLVKEFTLTLTFDFTHVHAYYCMYLLFQNLLFKKCVHTPSNKGGGVM
jgi:hypothetical protein